MLTGNFYYTVYFIFCYFRKIESLHHYTEKSVAPQNESKKPEYTHPYTTTWTADGASRPPPQNESKSLHTLTRRHQLNSRHTSKGTVSKGTLLDSPPQNESKKYPYTHPYTQPIEHQTTPQAAPCPTVPPKKSDLIFFLLLCCFFLWCFRFRWNLGSAAWAVALL